MKRLLLVLGLCVFVLAAPAHADEAPLSLDGKAFPGKIKAVGWYGLIPVRGTLGFEDGHLTWQVRGSLDRVPYEVTEIDGHLLFTATALSDEGRVEWSGVYDGQSLHNVQAVWTRATGDSVHDLLLPETVNLVFTPKTE